MKAKHLIFGVLGLFFALIVVYLLVIRTSEQKSDQLVLRIPDSKFMGLLPLYIADEKGFFKDQNIQVEWVEVSDPSQAEKSFLAGYSDLHATTFANSLQVEVRQPGTLSLIVPTSESLDKPGSYFLVRSDSPIQSLSDLKGKKIGTYSGPSQKAYAQLVLDKIGFSPGQDYELIQVTSSAQVQALLGGTFDALFTVEPYGSLAVTHGARILEEGVRPKYIANPFWIGAFVVKKEFTQDSKRMNAITSAIDKAISFIRDQDTESRLILAQRTNIDTTTSARCRLYNWTTKPSEADIGAMQSLVDLLVQQKLLDAKVEIKPLLYPTAQQ